MKIRTILLMMTLSSLLSPVIRLLLMALWDVYCGIVCTVLYSTKEAVTHSIADYPRGWRPQNLREYSYFRLLTGWVAAQLSLSYIVQGHC